MQIFCWANRLCYVMGDVQMVNVFVLKPCTPDRAPGTGLRSWGKRKVKKKGVNQQKLRKKKKRRAKPADC